MNTRKPSVKSTAKPGNKYQNSFNNRYAHLSTSNFTSPLIHHTSKPSTLYVLPLSAKSIPNSPSASASEPSMNPCTLSLTLYPLTKTLLQPTPPKNQQNPPFSNLPSPFLQPFHSIPPFISLASNLAKTIHLRLPHPSTIQQKTKVADYLLTPLILPHKLTITTDRKRKRDASTLFTSSLNSKL